MPDKFTFTSSGEAQMVEFALDRNRYTHELVKQLATGNFLGLVREVLEGRAQICRVEHLTSVSAAVAKIFRIWKTLPVGGVSKKELQKRLADGNFYVSDWAKDIMGKPAFTTSAEAHEVSFVRVKIGDLGFTKEPTTTELCSRERLAGFGLDLCEPEDGPSLRLAVSDEPKNDWFWVGMLPITVSVGDPKVFFVGRRDGGEQWLRASCADPSHRWHLSHEIVFRLRK